VCVRACVWSLPPDGEGLWSKHDDVAWISLLLQTPVSLRASSRSSHLFVVRVFLQSTRKHHCSKLLVISYYMCSVVSPGSAFFILRIVYSGSKFCPAFWKMLAFECRIEISEISLRFTLKRNVVSAVSVNALRRWMPSVVVVVLRSALLLRWTTV
jgi:hypothetical protein